MRGFYFFGTALFWGLGAWCLWGAPGDDTLQVRLICASGFLLFGIASMLYGIYYDKMTRREQDRELKKRERESKKRHRKAGPWTMALRSLVYAAAAVYLIWLVSGIPFAEWGFAEPFCLLMVLVCLYASACHWVSRWASRKGYAKLARITSNEYYKELGEQAELDARRQQWIGAPRDRDTLVLIEDVTSMMELRRWLYDYADIYCSDHVENMVQLWKLGRGRYAATFPAGISRIALLDFVGDISLAGTVTAWCRSEHTKRTQGTWTMIVFSDGKPDFLAVDDSGGQWSADYDDEQMLFRSAPQQHLAFTPRPSLDLGGNSYNLYF